MKAVKILEVLSQASVRSGQFDVIYLQDEINYNYFVKTVLSSFYQEDPALDNCKLKGYVFYIWNEFKLNFDLAECVKIHKIHGVYLYIISVD